MRRRNFLLLFIGAGWPETEAETLSGKKVMLPLVFGGKPAVVVWSFSKTAGEKTCNWLLPLTQAILNPWGEAMLAATFIFGVMFVAFGVVPHQFIDHADKNLGWNKSKIVYGPFDLLKPKALGGNFPMTIPYEAIRDIVVVLIHVWFFGLIIYLWKVWQTRGEKQTAKTAAIESSYGRPLVKKA